MVRHMQQSRPQLAAHAPNDIAPVRSGRLLMLSYPTKYVCLQIDPKPVSQCVVHLSDVSLQHRSAGLDLHLHHKIADAVSRMRFSTMPCCCTFPAFILHQDYVVSCWSCTPDLHTATLNQHLRPMQHVQASRPLPQASTTYSSVTMGHTQVDHLDMHQLGISPNQQHPT